MLGEEEEGGGSMVEEVVAVPSARETRLDMLEERGVRVCCSSWEKGLWLEVGGEERGRD